MCNTEQLPRELVPGVSFVVDPTVRVAAILRLCAGFLEVDLERMDVFVLDESSCILPKTIFGPGCRACFFAKRD